MLPKNDILNIEHYFIDVCRKLKTKVIEHELYYVVYSSACGMHAIKLNNIDKLEPIYNPLKYAKGQNYLDFSKYGIEWHINAVLGNEKTIPKERIIELMRTTYLRG